MLKKYTFVLFCLLTISSFSQNSKIDSLDLANRKEKLNQLLFQDIPKINNNETEKILKLYDDAESIATSKLGNYRVFIYSGKARLYEKIGDTKNAMFYMNKAYKTAVDFGDLIGSARALQLKGIYYGKRNLLDSSENYIAKSIKIVEKNIYNPIVDSLENKNLLLNLKSNLALNHLLQKKHKSSIDYAYESYELAKKLKNKRTETLSLGYIAGNYYALGQNKKALEFYIKGVMDIF